MYGKYGSDATTEQDQIEEELVYISDMLEGLYKCKDGDDFASCCTYTITKRRPVPCAYCKFTLFKELERKYGILYTKKKIGRRMAGKCHLCDQEGYISMGHKFPFATGKCKYFGFTIDNIIGTCDECEGLIGCNELQEESGYFSLNREVTWRQLIRIETILSHDRYTDYTITKSGSMYTLDMVFPVNRVSL